MPTDIKTVGTKGSIEFKQESTKLNAPFVLRVNQTVIKTTDKGNDMLANGYWVKLESNDPKYEYILNFCLIRKLKMAKSTNKADIQI